MTALMPTPPLRLLGDRLDPFEGLPHAALVAAAPGPTQQEPVSARPGPGLQREGLGDLGPAVDRAQLVTPVVDLLVPHLDHEAEVLERHAVLDLALGPVDRPDAVPLHVPLEVGTHGGTRGVTEPLRLERLRT